MIAEGYKDNGKGASVSGFIMFNDDAILSYVDAATRDGLSAAGVMVRRTVMQSIRFKPEYGRASTRGMPPFTHTDSPYHSLRKAIQFAYYPAEKMVLVGATLTGDIKIGKIHEFGDSINSKHIREFHVGDYGAIRHYYIYGQRMGLYYSNIEGRASQQIVWHIRLKTQALVDNANETLKMFVKPDKPRNYPKRAFMKPALDENIPKIAPLFRKAIRSAT